MENKQGLSEQEVVDFLKDATERISGKTASGNLYIIYADKTGKKVSPDGREQRLDLANLISESDYGTLKSDLDSLKNKTMQNVSSLSESQKRDAYGEYLTRASKMFEEHINKNPYNGSGVFAYRTTIVKNGVNVLDYGFSSKCENPEFFDEAKAEQMEVIHEKEKLKVGEKKPTQKILHPERTLKTPSKKPVEPPKKYIAWSSSKDSINPPLRKK